jgi:hypothetical protein
MNRKIFFFLLIAIVYYACEVENAQPDKDGITDEITCKINGENFKAFPNQAFNGWFKNAEIYLEQGNTGEFELDFHAYVRVSDSLRKELNFVCKFDTINPLQVFTLASEKSRFAVEIDLKDKYKEYELDTLFKREVKITKFDSSIRNIRGEFNFRAINYKNKDTLQITEGMFNCKYLK